MKLPSTKFLVLNGAAVTLIGVALVTQVKSIFTTPPVPTCASYYESAVGLSLERAGQLVTAADIQAGAAGADYGVLDNLTTQRVKDGPSAAALSIALKEGTAHPDHTREPKGGIAFPWRPRSMPDAAPALCLSYSVFLPAKFDFGKGVGTLPGVSASSHDATSDEAVSVHFGWGSGGRARMRSAIKTAKDLKREGVDSETILPRGRWFRVDQEIGLNTPAKNNGLMRFWIDGNLVAENWTATLRSAPAVKLDGVLADVHFGANVHNVDGRAVKDETIMISPFELRWRK